MASMPECLSCSSPYPEGAKFCAECGLAVAPAGAARRRRVVALFCDLVGSTQLGELLDPEVLRRVLERYFDVARSSIQQHGGTVEKFVGDAVVGSFGVPTVHEDDVLRAVRAALELRAGVADLDQELGRPSIRLQVRIAIHCGEVFADDAAAQDGRIVGDVFNTAARLQTSAAPGEVVVSGAAEPMIRNRIELESLGAIPLKGKSKPVDAYRVLREGRASLHHTTPLVGRDKPLARMRDAFEDAVAAHAWVLLTILAPAGVGKSRLAAAFAEGIADPGTVLIGQTPSYGDGVTFAPLVELLGHAAGLPAGNSEVVAAGLRRTLAGEKDAEAVGARLAQLLGIGEASAGDAAWAVRRLLETMAAVRPLVVILEDIHWAEAPMLDLVDFVVDRLRGPVLVVCLARPELLELRPTWAAGKPRATTVTLPPLASEDARHLTELLLGAQAPGAVVERVCATAEGNALYLEQLAAMFVDQGLLAGGRWVGPVDAHFEIPATLQALLAARCDRLEPATRLILEQASVEGRRFRLEGVKALAREVEVDEVERAIASLERRGFVEPEDEAAGRWRFSHALLRESAYAELSKELRAELHEKLADWISIVDANEPDVDESVARHLERALHLREELMLRDERSDEIARRAGELFADAGTRAFAALDLLTARELLGRAAILLPELSPRRLELLPGLGVALSETGRAAEAEALLANGVEQAKRAGSERAVLRATVGLLSARIWGSPTDTQVEAVAKEVLVAAQTLEAQKDDLGLAEAAIALEYMEFMRGRLGRALDWTRVALLRGTAARSAREATQAAADLVGHSVYGPLPFGGFAASAEELHDREDPHSLSAHGALLANAAIAKGDRQGFVIAEGLWRDVVDGHGLVWLGAAYDLVTAKTEITAGDPEAGERRLRDAREIIVRLGDLWWLGVIDSDICAAVWLQGSKREYLRLADAYEELVLFMDRQTLVRRSVIRARALLLRGSASDAELAAREALRLVEGTDLELDHAEAHLALADILDARGLADDAADARAQALERYRAKQHLTAVAYLTTP